MKKKRIISAILVTILFVSAGILGGVSVFAADNTAARGAKGEIDVYLIAGQSNAVGYGSDGLSASIMNDPRYTDGFENVLYYGVAEANDRSEFVPVTVGLGKDSGRVGAEVGIASVVGDSARKSAIIKHAIGGSYLYPTTDGTAALNYGTWTSPSYIEKYGVNTDTNKIGDIYEAFMQTVTIAITKLVAEGYTPVVKGIWWMQGEAETPYEAPAKAYEELLSMLISDMRKDIGEIVHSDSAALSDLPFVMGKIKRNPNDKTQPPYVQTVNEAQVSVTSEIPNTFIVDTSALTQIDGWHFTADSQHWLGAQFVNTVIASEGKHSVTLSGANVNMTGGGSAEAGSVVTVTFTPYENCTVESVKIKIGSSAAVEIELDANGSYTFTMPSESVVFEVNTNDPGAVITKYGVIPSKFADADKYVFILFKNGEMINAFEDWHTFVNGNYLTGCTLLMRRDYSTTEGGDEWGLVYVGDLTLDLDGHTLTRGDYHLFQALGKGTAAHSTHLKVTNGTIKAQFYKDTLNSEGKQVSTSPVIVFNNESTSTASDYFEFVFDGVIFDVSEGRGIVTCYDGGSVGSKSKIVFNDCTFNRGAKTNNMTLFSLTDADNKNDVEIIINGGKLVADSLKGLTIATYNEPSSVGKGSDDTVTLGLGTNGKTLTVDLPEEYTVPTDIKFALTDGGYYPMNPVLNSETGKKSYTLVNLGTPYGDIDPAYISVDDYPFALFKDGVMIYAFSNWKTFIDSDAYKTANYQTGCTLLLRRDYSTSEASGSNWALSYIKDLVIDLGTNTLTRGNNHLFNVIGHGTTNNSTVITVTNGTLKGNFYKDGTTSPTTSILTFNNDSNSTSTDTFVFNFNGVIFDITEGRGIVQSTSNSSYKTGKTVNTVNFNNCEFLRGNMTNVMTLFNLSNAANRNDIEIVINGGKLVAGKTDGLANLVFADFNEGTPSPDSIKLIGDFEVVLPSGAAYPSNEYAFTGVSYFLLKNNKSTDSSTVYTLTDVEMLTTDYGKIKAAYASVDEYPFVLFKNGEMIHAFRDWQVFIDTDMRGNASYQTGCTLLLRRDYSTTETAKNCWALSWIKDIEIDLGGHTLTRGNTHLFNAISHGAANTTTIITIFNGTLSADLLKSDGKSATSPAICFNNDGKSTSTDTYIFNLNGLILDVSTGRGLLASYNDGTDTSRVNATVNYNDCTIKRGSKTGPLTLFALADANDRNDIKVYVNGGDLETNKTLDGIVFATVNDSRGAGNDTPDKLVFGKGNDGKYLTVIAPFDASVSSLDGTYNTDIGVECVFVKAAENDEYVSYTLYPDVMVGFKVKTNVTLYSNFVFNVYIPVSGVYSFTVDGNTVDYEETELDGVAYYLVRINLASGKALSDIALKVTLNSGETTVDATWTLSILKYARNVINGNYDETTVKLVKDMLAYASAAHTYFKNELSAEKTAEVAALLSGYSREMPEGDAKKPNNSDYVTDATVYVGETPSFRFNIADGYTVDDFTFTVGGRRVEAVLRDGYIEIVMYAYMMLDDVTYTVVDKNTGVTVTETYNLYSYYEYAKTLNDEKLIAVVEGLMKYSVSADRYRDVVNAK